MPVPEYQLWGRVACSVAKGTSMEFVSFGYPTLSHPSVTKVKVHEICMVGT